MRIKILSLKIPRLVNLFITRKYIIIIDVIMKRVMNERKREQEKVKCLISFAWKKLHLLLRMDEDSLKLTQ